MSPSSPIPAASASSQATIAWDQTGVLYTAMTALGTLSLVSMTSHNPMRTSFSLVLLDALLYSSLFGTTLGVAQWIALRRLVHRSLQQITPPAELHQNDRRWVRNAAWWIVMTVAGSVVGGAFNAYYEFSTTEVVFLSHVYNTPLILYDELHYIPSWSIIALSQWLLLRRYIHGKIRWMAWTLVVSIVGSFVMSTIIRSILRHLVADGYWNTSRDIVLNLRLTIALTIIVPTTMFGLILGAVQARCLKRFHAVWFDTLGREHPPG